MTAVLRISGIDKRFGATVALLGASLEVQPGEVHALLGENGAGKSTLLAIVSGLLRPDGGTLHVDGEPYAPRSPRDARSSGIALIHQELSLFPHLTVAENVAFGLKYTRVTREERRRQVSEMLDVVRLAGFEDRKPTQLSGGQQQRVALARALILRPRVLLLDEPLGALDARLRKDLQVELKALQSDVGVTFVFVTHDQEEALTMSDRVAVMNNGRVEQAGSPQTVYEEPETLFVADFLGVSNLVIADAVGTENGDCLLEVGERSLRACQGTTDARGQVKAMIRPERVQVEPHGQEGGNRLPGMVEQVVFLGSFRELHVRILGGALVKAVAPNDGSPLPYEQGAPVTLHLPADAIRVLPPATE
jgi:spermidine/putrescine transport system ATP-binding protein